MKRSLKKLLFSISLVVALAVMSIGFINAAPRYEEGGGGGLTGFTNKTGYSYPAGTSNYVVLQTRAYLVGGWFSYLDEWRVLSDLGAFTYDDRIITNYSSGTDVSVTYYGLGSANGYNPTYLSGKVSVFF